jgi:hypothetical protein
VRDGQQRRLVHHLRPRHVPAPPQPVCQHLLSRGGLPPRREPDRDRGH